MSIRGRTQLFKKGGGQSLNIIGYSTERNVVSEGEDGIAARKFFKSNKH